MGTSGSQIVDEQQAAIVASMPKDPHAGLRKTLWSLSTGSSHHYVNDLKLLEECKTIKPAKFWYIQVGHVVVTQVGKASILVVSPKGKSRRLALLDVYYIPGAKSNVVSACGLKSYEGYITDIAGCRLMLDDQIVSETIEHERTLWLPVFSEDDQIRALHQRRRESARKQAGWR